MDYYAIYKASGQRDELAEMDWAANDPAAFQRLTPQEQSALVDWIRAVLAPAKTVFRRTSYGMKHDFEREPDGFYIYNGAFKGAMLAAGFDPVDASELNWCFRVKPSHPLCRWEQVQRRQLGRKWLVRDRWREKGYAVIETTARQRIMVHSRECWAERRPKVVVLRARSTAQVILDMGPAGCRLTRVAVAALLAVFEEYDPEGRRSVVMNGQSAVIRRVPVWKAEEVAVALVKIADGCRSRTITAADAPHDSVPVVDWPRAGLEVADDRSQDACPANTVTGE
ncbi:MAG: hypothetical protein IH602_21745 [Bryobacteraceae bacterium]|nr:hypothetical protein [Bryobacteraceae bacterium]